MNKQTRVVYGVLVGAWVLILAWQVVEHNRVKQAAKAALINRAKDISNTVGIVLRSQRHVITRERLESALNSLVKPEELNAVAMLNAAGDVVASAGGPIDFEMKGLVPTGEHWGNRTVALMNLVDIGTNVTLEADSPSRPTIVVPRNELFSRGGTNRPPPPDRRFGLGDPGPAPTNNWGASEAVRPGLGSNSPALSADRPSPRDGRERGRPAFGRPFWMSEDEWKATIEKKGVHSFVLLLSTHAMRLATSHDLWLRLIICSLASLSMVGLALAWSNLVKSGELEVRLIRAAELNTRLREMSLAAAGLAHETKNPLNIIRGLAQLISKEQGIAPELRAKSRGILDETDRVTAQLNEFINFSKPRQLRPSPVSLHSAVAEVVRALGPDLEEKNIRLQIGNDLPVIEADEQQLRQALFNLLINAIQAVQPGGEIHVTGSRLSTDAVLEIRDNGPGVPVENRTDVFKPYFTTNVKGTGLGLAVVQQIVLAHGWEIECLGNEPRGAVFRLSHLPLATAV